jgi:hypothetical protein
MGIIQLFEADVIKLFIDRFSERIQGCLLALVIILRMPNSTKLGRIMRILQWWMAVAEPTSARYSRRS